MSEILGMTGAIGSGKSIVASLLAETTPDHATYEVSHVIGEIVAPFNQALKAELAYETTADTLELVNQVLIWLPDAVSEYLHHDVVWNQLAISKQDTLQHPELYEKLFVYMQAVQKNRSLLDVPLTADTKEQFRPLLQWLGGYFIAKIDTNIWYDELMRRIDLHNPTTSLVIISGLRHPGGAAVIKERGGRIVCVERPGLQSDVADITEAQRSAIIPDITIINNGTLDQLRLVTEALANDLAAGSPKPRYSAA